MNYIMLCMKNQVHRESGIPLQIQEYTSVHFDKFYLHISIS